MLRLLFAIFCYACFILTPGLARAQDDQDVASELREKFRQAPFSFEVFGGQSATGKLKLLEQPVLSWSNPERRTPAGALYIWTLDGVPHVAMGLYPTADLSLDHEFQSLSPYPLKVLWDGAIVWQPTEAGMERKRIEDAAAPFDSKPARLRQMRGLAREFTARLVPPRRNPKPLRLLSSPLYRYPDNPASDVVDGAVFVFAQGTDPEVLLVIEAVEAPSSELKWQFGCARMTIVPLKVLRQNETVWETDSAWARQTLHTPYRVVKEN